MTSKIAFLTNEIKIYYKYVTYNIQNYFHINLYKTIMPLINKKILINHFKFYLFLTFTR